MLRRSSFAALLTAVVLPACQSAPQPAILAEGSPETLARVSDALAGAVERAQVELGPGDLTRQSTIAVLPSPLGAHEGNSLSMPELFDLVLINGDCFIQSRRSGDTYALTGVACRPAASD